MRVITCKFCKRLEYLSEGWAIFGIYQRFISPHVFPIRLPLLTLAMEVERERGDPDRYITFSAVLKDDRGICISTTKGEIPYATQIDGIFPRQWVSCAFGRLGHIPHPGVYRVEITIERKVHSGDRLIVARG